MERVTRKGMRPRHPSKRAELHPPHQLGPMTGCVPCPCPPHPRTEPMLPAQRQRDRGQMPLQAANGTLTTVPPLSQGGIFQLGPWVNESVLLPVGVMISLFTLSSLSFALPVLFKGPTLVHDFAVTPGARVALGPMTRHSSFAVGSLPNREQTCSHFQSVR